MRKRLVLYVRLDRWYANTHIHTRTHIHTLTNTQVGEANALLFRSVAIGRLLSSVKLKPDEGRTSFHLDRGFVVGDRGPKHTFLRSFVRFLKNFQLFNQHSFSIFAWIRSRLRFSWSEITASSKNESILSRHDQPLRHVVDMENWSISDIKRPTCHKSNKQTIFHCIPLRLVTILRAERPIEPINPRLTTINRTEEEMKQIKSVLIKNLRYLHCVPFSIAQEWRCSVAIQRERYVECRWPPTPRLLLPSRRKRKSG